MNNRKISLSEFCEDILGFKDIPPFKKRLIDLVDNLDGDVKITLHRRRNDSRIDLSKWYGELNEKAEG